VLTRIRRRQPLSHPRHRLAEKRRGWTSRPTRAWTPEIAQEICERTGSAVALEGSIASLGTQYVLGLKAVNCRNAETLDEEQVQAAKGRRAQRSNRSSSRSAVTNFG
jgi:hypothetical protein